MSRKKNCLPETLADRIEREIWTKPVMNFFRKFIESSKTKFASKHIMQNNSIDRKKKQRHTELMKVFDLLKKQWPECFDNIGMYLPEAELAVCKK